MMDRDKPIPGGYFMVSRKLFNSCIIDKPPEYIKVWLYLISKAHHSPKNNLQRGQGFASIPELQDVLSFRVGYRVERPSKKKVWGILEWLRNPCEQDCEQDTKEPMIVTTKVTHGFLYTIVKYDVYQDPSNYEGNSEGNNEEPTKVTRRKQEGNNKYKNYKELKNDKNVEEVVDHAADRSAIKRLVKVYSQNIATVPTAAEYEYILSWLNEGIDPDLIEWAIVQAALLGGKNAKYVNTILFNKHKAGITTKEQAEAYEKIREAKKQGKEPVAPMIDETPVLTEEQIRRSEELDRILLGEEGDPDADREPEGPVS